MYQAQNIDEHIAEENKKRIVVEEGALGVLRAIALAAKHIRREVLLGALSQNCVSDSITNNASGDDVKKMDEISNDYMKHILEKSGYVAVMGSEEEEGVVEVENKSRNAEYVVLFDPLDGSSNIDVVASVGTIFSVYKTTGKSAKDDCLQEGKHQVLAGYVLYGSSTVLVYTAKNGVHGFTYHPEVGEFLLSNPDIKIPNKNTYYSINEGLSETLFSHTQELLGFLKGKNNIISALSGRYVGALVADFHRNLLKGGIYLYPGTQKHPKGKLRLVYEANPLALICEQAGGKASNGVESILELKPEKLHEKTPLYIGNTSLVEKVIEYGG